MADIINFQEYVKTKKKRDDEAKTSNILFKNGQIINFKKEDIRL